MYDELETKENEVDDLNESLEKAKDMCRKLSALNHQDQEDIKDLRNMVEEQRIKISCLRKHRNEIIDRHEKHIDDYEIEFKAKEVDIKHLQDTSKQMKQQICDLKEEIIEKDVKLAELNTKIDRKKNIDEMKSTQTSLFEELAGAESDQIKKDLQDKNDNLENKLLVEARHSQRRRAMYAKLNILESENKYQLEKLEKKIRKVANVKDLSKCRYGAECIRKFCHFDHSFVFKKVNKHQSLSFPCRKCHKVFKTQHSFAHHMEDHETIESDSQKDEPVEVLSRQVEFAQEGNLSCHEDEQYANDDNLEDSEDSETLESSVSSSNSDEYSNSSETEWKMGKYDRSKKP